MLNAEESKYDRGHVLYNPRAMYDRSDYKFKSKIICTLGPVSREVPVLEDMLRQGGVGCTAVE
jgi:hypothetical protein